jgi:hypothetical protein
VGLGGVGRYTLEVITPFVQEFPTADEEQLESALDAVAIVHGGMVVESEEASARKFQRQYVNIFDCENSLEEEVKWLRKKFPDSRFTLKEFTTP